MKKPENPYPRGTLIWSVMEGDWADLTAGQIAEVMGTTKKSVDMCMTRIKKKTGYIVPRLNRRVKG